MRNVGFVFPGQGSQYVGMGQTWADESPVARQTFAEADDSLEFALSQLCWHGPEADLQLTANTQPALLATSIAVFRVLQEEGVNPIAVAGHSLGEYSALVAAGALEFGQALRLVRRRGEAMQEAVPLGEGSMAAILGLEAEDVRAATHEAAPGEVCSVANYNAPGQVVIAGQVQAVDRAVELCKAKGARRAVLLPVSAPFHCPLMAPARESLTPYLRQTNFQDPRVPVICNVDARPVGTADEAREALRRQIDGAVRWDDCVRWMASEEGTDLFVEVGPGKVLTGLNRRITPKIKTLPLGEPGGLVKLRARLEESS